LYVSRGILLIHAACGDQLYLWQGNLQGSNIKISADRLGRVNLHKVRTALPSCNDLCGRQGSWDGDSTYPERGFQYFRHKACARDKSCSCIEAAFGGLAVEYLFKAVHIAEPARPEVVARTGFQWNYTTVLNLIALAAFAAGCGSAGTNQFNNIGNLSSWPMTRPS